MSIVIIKGSSDYSSQSLVNGVTLIDKEMMFPIDEHLGKVSEKIKNTVVTINFSATDWITDGDYKMLVITHPYETLDIACSCYRFESAMYIEEANWCKVISTSEFRIYNDEAIQGKAILIFDISK